MVECGGYIAYSLTILHTVKLSAKAQEKRPRHKRKCHLPNIHFRAYVSFREGIASSKESKTSKATSGSIRDIELRILFCPAPQNSYRLAWNSRDENPCSLRNFHGMGYFIVAQENLNMNKNK